MSSVIPNIVDMLHEKTAMELYMNFVQIPLLFLNVPVIFNANFENYFTVITITPSSYAIRSCKRLQMSK